MKWNKKYKKNILVIGIILIASTVWAIKYRFTNNWSTFVSNGVVTSKLFNIKNVIVFGTNSSKLFFLNLNSKGDLKSLDLNTGNTQPVEFVGKNLLAISDDSLRLIDSHNAKVVWEVYSDNQYMFQKAHIYKNFVYAGSADGSLNAYRVTDGNFLWKFTPKKLEMLTTVISGGSVHYFGNFKIYKGRIYLVSHDKSVYSINIKDGSVMWSTPIDETVNEDIGFSGDNLYLSTLSGKIIAINLYSGKIAWKVSNDSPIVCTMLTAGEKFSDIPQAQFFLRLSYISKKPFYHNQGSLIILDSNGVLKKIKSSDGTIEWQSENLGKSTNCPVIWRDKIITTSTTGGLVALSSNSGGVLYSKHELGVITNSVYVDPNFNRVLPEWLNIFPPRIFVNNTGGVLWAFNGNSGKNLWSFSAGAPTQTAPIVWNSKVIFPTSDGTLYKINKFTGKTVLSWMDKQYKVSSSFIDIGKTKVYEITLKSKGSFSNPWREGVLDGYFTDTNGKEYHIPGFYYGQNEWKVRFNPPITGNWKWKLEWAPHGSLLTTKGGFESTTETKDFFIKTSTVNRKRLTLDHKTIFNGMGLGDTFGDINYNSTPLDDWATGESSTVTATTSAGITNWYKSDKIVSLDDYIATYGPKGAGFNIFRWSIMNASQSLWTSFGFPTSYSILQGKNGDDLVERLRKNDMHVWLTMFGFDIPYKGSGNPAETFLLKSYVRYVFARYGAYVDVWELANEIAIPLETAKLLKEEIKMWDYEKRPVSTTSVGFNYDDSDIIAPHWYETEKLSESDIKTLENIKKVDFDRPTVFAEQGNLGANYDSTSGIRMRVRLWTSFFNSAILIFWNQSDSKDYKAGIFPGNLYIGKEERSYSKVLQDFTTGFPLTAKPVQYRFENRGIRGYGLQSDSLTGVYFFHYSDPFKPTSFSFSILTRKSGEVQWVDPATGKIIKSDFCNPGNCVLTSPAFKTDLALKII